MHLRLVIFACLLFFRVTAQDSTRNTFGAQFSRTQSDLYLGANYSILNKHFEHRFQLEFGFIRTFFQFRTFPQLSYQLGYNIFDMPRFRSGLFVRPAVNLIHANRSAKQGWFFSEAVYPGIMVEFGSVSRFRLSAGLGPWIEQKYSDFNQRYTTAFHWQYLAEISWSYALH